MTEERWSQLRKFVFATTVLITILSGFLCGLFGCEISSGTPADMQIKTREITCRGALDAGKMAWWNGYGEPIGFPFPIHVRYVCKDHGPDRNGWWFEAEPEGRVMP